jgi:hypothetical protein
MSEFDVKEFVGAFSMWDADVPSGKNLAGRSSGPESYIVCDEVGIYRRGKMVSGGGE